MSIRIACKQLTAAVSTYNRFAIVVDSGISSPVRWILRFIPPENIISLTLFDTRVPSFSMSQFFQLVNPNRFNQLRFVNLYGIRDMELTYFLQKITDCTRISLAIESSERQHKTTLNIISLMATRFNIVKLGLNSLDNIIDSISWFSTLWIKASSHYYMQLWPISDSSQHSV